MSILGVFVNCRDTTIQKRLSRRFDADQQIPNKTLVTRLEKNLAKLAKFLVS